MRRRGVRPAPIGAELLALALKLMLLVETAGRPDELLALAGDVDELLALAVQGELCRLKNSNEAIAGNGD